MGDPFSNKIAEILASEEEYLSHRSQPTMASSTAATRVLRTTMFRIPDAANQQKLIQAYSKLAAEQKKVCPQSHRPVFCQSAQLNTHPAPRTASPTSSTWQQA